MNLCFQDVLIEEKQVRELIGNSSEVAKHKSIHHIDSYCREFIAKTPLIFISTSDKEGNCDVSPRGDAAGFVLVLDDKHLVIPERPGNRRIDSVRNILSSPRIGLIFLIPGLEETLRINGRACITKNPELMNRMQAREKTPLLGIGVEVEECYVHCAKAFKRSQTWEAGSWLNQDLLPKVSKMLVAHVNREDFTEEIIAKGLKESYEKRLY
ncbi:pyridoxamine 5'-phosphate oxidase family protein [Paenibacillus larvae]